MKLLKSYEIKIALLITSGFVIKRAYDLLKYKILQLETRVTKLEYPIQKSGGKLNGTNHINQK
ncbi:hypothetical protein RGR08_11590 [Staphylococcus epidermidis]|uniref:hypothetical protein n=1 Tax=Staphylococcus epidermidis TaxID=1282 RepID=UPI003F8840B6